MIKPVTHFIIDFDSTFIQVEAFDELCKLCYLDEDERFSVLEKVAAITNKGMSGEISITESLESRLLLLNAHKKHLAPLIAILCRKVSDSFKANAAFLKNNCENIYIVSNGFTEFILPVVVDYGIKPQHVFANSFVYDAHDNIKGFDKTNVLASAKGKVKLISRLDLPGDLIVIGDGYTDYEIMEAGFAKRFYAFTENITRDNVVCKTEYVINSFDRVVADFEKNNEVLETINLLKKSL